jgi:hypothetical protein
MFEDSHVMSYYTRVCIKLRVQLVDRLSIALPARYTKLKSVKLLGVFLDEYFTFNKHISYVWAKLTRANFCLRRIENFVSI